MGRRTGLEWADGKLVLEHLRGSAIISYERCEGNAYTLRTFTHSLLCAYLRAILHCMQGEVDLRHWLLLVYRANGVVQLVGAVRTMASRIRVHVRNDNA